MRSIEQKIQEVNSTMAMEGMPLTEDDKEALRSVLRGEVSYEEMKSRILSDYQPVMVAHEQV